LILNIRLLIGGSLVGLFAIISQAEPMRMTKDEVVAIGKRAIEARFPGVTQGRAFAIHAHGRVLGGLN